MEMLMEDLVKHNLIYAKTTVKMGLCSTHDSQTISGSMEIHCGPTTGKQL